MGGNRTGAYMLSRETEVDVISVSSVTSGSCRVTQDVRYASLCFRIYSFISLFLLDVSSEVRLFDATWKMSQLHMRAKTTNTVKLVLMWHVSNHVYAADGREEDQLISWLTFTTYIHDFISWWSFTEQQNAQMCAARLVLSSLWNFFQPTRRIKSVH